MLGLEFDYAGVIIGPDMRFEDGRVEDWVLGEDAAGGVTVARVG